MYATAQDLRDEGVSLADASDVRLIALIAEATDTIDRLTGWFFEPRARTLRMDGRGQCSLDLPWVPLVLDRVVIDDDVIEQEEVRWWGSPVEPGFAGPRVELRNGTFGCGVGNVELEGTWGYTEADGTRLGRTPLAIRRACMLLAMRMLPRIGDQDAVHEARDRWRLVEMRTRDQSVKFAASPSALQPLSGDPEVDALLRPYMRPIQLGAV